MVVAVAVGVSTCIASSLETFAAGHEYRITFIISSEYLGSLAPLVLDLRT